MAELFADDQYLRKCQLIVSSIQTGKGLDFSELRIKFSVKRSSYLTPNVGDIKIYNVDAQTANELFTTLKPKVSRDGVTSVDQGQVLLQGGYEGNYGVIFQGNIKQIIIGRESATDTFIELICGDGDRAFNFSVVNTTIAAGATQTDQVNAAVGTMVPKGVTAGHIGEMPTTKLPRGKVMYGNARDYLKQIATTTDKSFSIQDGKVTFIPLNSYLPGEAVVLTSNTGMIGTPQQTNEGLNVKCLLNPRIPIGGRLKIDNASIARLPINLQAAGSSANVAAPLNADGMYYVLAAEHQGDTRGQEWYTTMVCLNVDVTTNSLNGSLAGG